jgi:drug/metabolite transporter (DMT)-like permease
MPFPLRSLLTGLAMVAFAGNSLLCRLALERQGMDAATFTLIRLLSGSLMLALLAGRLGFHAATATPRTGSWAAALALFTYAICFSTAYVNTPAASGALLLFGAVQISLIGHGLWQGESLSRRQVAGLMIALAGLIALLRPGVAAPPATGALLMVTAGMAWATYTVIGRSVSAPVAATGANFLRAVPMGLVAVVLLPHGAATGREAIGTAVISGAVTSALGYALWYHLLPRLAAIEAASVQLSVPVMTAVGASFWLGERLSFPSVIAGAVALGGIGLINSAPGTQRPRRGTNTFDQPINGDQP